MLNWYRRAKAAGFRAAVLDIIVIGQHTSHPIDHYGFQKQPELAEQVFAHARRAGIAEENSYCSIIEAMGRTGRAPT